MDIVFSCVAFFETGSIDLSPEDFVNAIAIAHEDSIFVPQKLLLDPCVTTESSLLKRIAGNIGKPGLSILVPPVIPRVRQMETGMFNVVNFSPFDGSYIDAFASTTLHLRFTGFEMPLNTGDQGTIYHQACVLETLIQVFDRDRWVADLDILRALERCKFGWPQHMCDSLRNRIVRPLQCIDTWDELLDMEHSGTIVRATGNHLARLAVIAVLSQRDAKFRVISQEDLLQYNPEQDTIVSRSASQFSEDLSLSELDMDFSQSNQPPTFPVPDPARESSAPNLSPTDVFHSLETDVHEVSRAEEIFDIRDFIVDSEDPVGYGSIDSDKADGEEPLRMGANADSSESEQEAPMQDDFDSRPAYVSARAAEILSYTDSDEQLARDGEDAGAEIFVC